MRWSVALNAVTAQHVAQLPRSRTLQTVDSFAEQTGQGRRQHPLQCSRPRSGAGPARIDQLDPDRLLHLMPDNKHRARKVIDDARLPKRGPPTRVWMSDRSYQKMHI